MSASIDYCVGCVHRQQSDNDPPGDVTCTNPAAEFTAAGCTGRLALQDDSDWIAAVLSDFPPPRSMGSCA
jgi:hypothetical protein